MKVQLFWIIILNLFWVGSCEAQSKLPEKIPEKVSFSYYEGGGMSRSYKKIRIAEGVVEFEEMFGNQSEPQKWSANLSDADSANLYRIFVENKFDRIKNDERKEIVYDAGSETISISVNLKSFNVTYGKNSPLSGKDLSRFQAVRKAIDELLEKSKNQKNDNSLDMTISEAEEFIKGKWRATGEHSSKHTWYLEWTFNSGKFKQVGYPPILQEGKYKIVVVGNGKITLELYEQKGTFGEEKKTIEIVISSQTKLLNIERMNGFSKITE
ncbi:MAG: hypothetical protein HC846_05290 [Blastocatellia bacterium]|nr:hypothetical protein [Blastocatellia bacterium]